MKLINIFKIAIISIRNLKWKIVLVCFVTFCSFFLIDQIVTGTFQFMYHSLELKNMITYGEKDTYQLQFPYTEETEEFTNKVSELLLYIGSLEHVKGAGNYDCTSVEFNELSHNGEYIEKNKKLFANSFLFETPEISEVLFVNKNLSDLCKLDSLEGKDNFRELDTGDYLPVLVGFHYKDIAPVGMKLTIEGSSKKYIVVGILKKGSLWYGDIDPIGTKVEELDSQFVVAREQEELIEENDMMDVLCTLSTSYYILDKNGDPEKIEKKILEKAEKLKLQVLPLSMEAVIKDYDKSYEEGLRTTIMIALLFIAFSVLSISSSAVVSILLRKSEYGIMYANGFSMVDIKKEIILENIYIVGISGCFAYAINTFLLLTNKNGAFVKIASKVHVVNTLPILLMTAVLVITISSMIPVLIIKRMKPVTLIGGNE